MAYCDTLPYLTGNRGLWAWASSSPLHILTFDAPEKLDNMDEKKYFTKQTFGSENKKK